jgi:hypothetical protein
MFIHDLEYIDSFKELPKSSLKIAGGVSAGASVSATSTQSPSIGVSASASASGDLSRSGTTVGTTLIVREAGPNGIAGYTAGYGTGYATAYGVDRYGNRVTAFDSDSVTI